MNLMELVQSVQYVVDKRGNRKSVQLDYTIWEEVLTLLEDIEDAEELEEAEEEEDTLVPWQQVVADYKKTIQRSIMYEILVRGKAAKQIQRLPPAYSLLSFGRAAY